MYSLVLRNVIHSDGFLGSFRKEGDKMANNDADTIEGICAWTNEAIRGRALTFSAWQKSGLPRKEIVGYVCPSCRVVSAADCNDSGIGFRWWSGYEKSRCSKCGAATPQPIVVIPEAGVIAAMIGDTGQEYPQAESETSQQDIQEGSIDDQLADFASRRQRERQKKIDIFFGSMVVIIVTVGLGVGGYILSEERIAVGIMASIFGAITFSGGLLFAARGKFYLGVGFLVFMEIPVCLYAVVVVGQPRFAVFYLAIAAFVCFGIGGRVYDQMMARWM